MPDELAKVENKPLSTSQQSYTREQIELLKRIVCKGATDDEFTLFTYVCKRSGLDPFARQIHAVKRWSKKDNREVMAIQTGIDGYRTIAERSQKYEGSGSPEWCDADGNWKDIWLLDTNPYACRVGVWKKGSREATYAVVYFDAVVQRYKGKEGNQGEPTEFWKGKKGVQQIAKCAEAAALRKAFPQDLSGIYIHEEMEQAENH